MPPIDDQDPDGTGESPSAAELATLKAAKSELDAIKATIADGSIHEPYVQKKIESGELFPKERFAGLSQKVNDLTEANKLHAEKAALVDTYKSQLDERSSEYKSLLELSTQNETAFKEASDKAARLENQVLRSKLIMSEFPDLSRLEADNALPAGNDEEELRKKFTSIQATIKQAADNIVSGNTVKKPAPENLDDNTSKLSELKVRLQEAKRDAITSQKWGAVTQIEKEIRALKSKSAK